MASIIYYFNSGNFESHLSSIGIWIRLYGFHTAISLVLCAITLYRRELSCNNGYHDLHPVRAPDSTNSHSGASHGNNPQNYSGSSISQVDVIHERKERADFLAPTRQDTCISCSLFQMISLLKFIWRTSTISAFMPFKKSKQIRSFAMDMQETFYSSHGGVGYKRDSTEKQIGSDSILPLCFNNTIHEWKWCTKIGFNCNSCLKHGNNQQKPSQDGTEIFSLYKVTNHLMVVPLDVMQVIFSYLDVDEVLIFGAVDKFANRAVHNPQVAFNLWKDLCLRDFDGLFRWPVAQLRYRESVTRSRHSLQAAVRGKLRESYSSREVARRQQKVNKDMIDVVTHVIDWHSKFSSRCHEEDEFKNNKKPQIYDLYFAIWECWLRWSIALRNTTQDCLVGLHGAVYDITAFLPHHPGSIETLLIHAGTDATGMFETVRHSRRARTLADGFCVMVPLPECSSLNRKHVLPSRYNSLERNHESANDGCEHEGVYRPVDQIFSRLRKHLQRVNQVIEASSREQLYHQSEIVVGDVVHTFYDPFAECWCAWYTSLTLEGELEPKMMYFNE